MLSLKSVLFGLALLLAAGGSVYAAENVEGAPLSQETREAMANVHAQMAQCLRSEESVANCREQAMKNCPFQDNGGCMMGSMMGHGPMMDAEKGPGMKYKKKMGKKQKENGVPAPQKKE